MKKIKTLSLLTLFLFINLLNVNSATYYVSSNSGNDSNLGISIAIPWRTIGKVNSETLVAGDSVLFKRGETWRGQLVPQSGNSVADVYYGAYSSGSKPTILGSINASNTSDWVALGSNIWESVATYSTDVGNIIFDNAFSVGFKKWSLGNLLNQDDFWFNLSTSRVLIYSISNPAINHAEIELALRIHIVNQENTSYVTYENLAIKYGASHGFGGGNTANITISSCEISYIGGGDLDMDGLIRFGNGVEFWGNASNNTVEKCKIWEIYDTGVTNQNHTTPSTQQNIRYSNNLIWNCGLASFEYWNRPSTSVTADIYFENNTCLYAGGGWGIQRPDYHGIHAMIDANPAVTDTIYIRNNIFYNAQRSIYAVEDNINGFINLDFNLVNQSAPTDTLFVSFPSFTLFTFADFNSYTSTTNKDLNSITGNPNFVDINGLDFQLTNLSPCIDNGIPVNLTEDFNGDLRPFYVTYDIGAYEFSGSLTLQEIVSTERIHAYPNPAQDYLFISEVESFENIQKLSIVSLNGEIILKLKDFDSANSLNVSKIVNGFYFVLLESKKGGKGMVKIQIIK